MKNCTNTFDLEVTNSILVEELYKYLQKQIYYDGNKRDIEKEAEVQKINY